MGTRRDGAPGAMTMRVAVICSEGSVFNRRVLPARLAAVSELAGIVSIRDRPSSFRRRLGHEWRRSKWRIVDVLAFRIFYRLWWASRDRRWIAERSALELRRFAPPTEAPVHETDDPNTPETRAFLESIRPDVAVAACKTLLHRDIFDVPTHGTFVVHPGICPEYRNSHGCFWALSRGDVERVGATLLRIDEGVDTGPVYAYYRPEFDSRSESHVVIQLKSVYDNFDQIAKDIVRVRDGDAEPIDVSGRKSAAWGQPRLTDYIRWKRAARRSA
jgi:hypothetical protein